MVPEAWRKPRDRATGDRIGSGKAAGEDGQEEKGNQMSKDEGGRNSSFSEKPVRSRLRRLVDWINLTAILRGGVFEVAAISLCSGLRVGLPPGSLLPLQVSPQGS